MNAKQRATNAKETERLLELAIKRAAEFSNSCRASDQKDNPQIIQMRLRADAQVEAMQDVLDALRGDFTCLKIMAIR